MTPPADSPGPDVSKAAVMRALLEATRLEGRFAPGAGAPVPAVSVPDHELLAMIGHGSYGQVWLARNVMGTYRAVKMVTRASFETARPFDREFNGILKFEPLSRTHSGLVDILQVGRTDECFYYVMELADDVDTGQLIDPLHYTPRTLRTELDAHGRLPFERCLRLALALTEALGHLHAHGLLHRDLKPSNIIFVHDQPKLADIGLVAELSEAKSFVGTDGFIPPEGAGTAQADLFSLGKLFYELATGKDRHDFPELPTLTGETPDSDTGLLELNAVILKACQPDPKHRYQSAGELRDDLLLLQSGRSVQRSQVLESRLARARRVTAVAVGLALLTVAAFLFFQRQARREASLRARAVAGELAARRNLYAADLQLAARALAENNRGRAVALLSKHLPGNTGPTNDLRGWEWRMLWQRTRSDELFTLGRHTNYVAALALSLDGRTLYSASKDHTVGIWDLTARRQTGSLRHGGDLHDLDLARDGRSLATSDRENVLRIWDLPSQTVRFAWTNAFPIGFVRFTPEGDRLVYRDAEGVWVLDPGRGRRTELLHLPHEEISYISSAAFSPDGRRFAFDGGDYSIHLLDWEHQTALGTFPPAGLEVDGHMKLGLAFSPDGRRLASAGKDGLYVWDVATRQTVWHVARTGNENWSGSPAFSPDGQLLATVHTDQRVQLWDTSDWTEVATLRGHEFEVWDVVFTPDGSQLITASKDKTIRAWPVPARTSPGSAGDRVTSAAGDPSARVWNSVTAGRPDLIPLPDDRVWAVLSRNGSQLLVIHANGQWAVSDPETGRLHNFGEWVGRPWGSPNAAVSDDGKRVVFGTDEQLVVFGDDGPGDPLVRLGEGPRLTQRAQDVLSFSPDGRHVLYATAGDAVRLLDVTTGTVETLFEPIGRRVYSVNHSPDGRRVAAGYSWALVQWRDLASPDIHRIETEHSEFVTSLAFSPDGQVLATGGFDTGIKLWNLNRGTRLAELSGSLQAFLSIHFSADGRRIAAGSYEGQVSIWDVEQIPPLEVLNWTDHGSPEQPGRSWIVRFRPDGSLISRGDDDLRVWRAPTLAEIDQARAAGDGRLPRADSGNGWEELPDPLIAPDAATLAWQAKRRATVLLNRGDVHGAAEADPHFALLPRDPRATTAQVDLSPHFNRSLAQDGFESNNDWRELPQGFQQLGGTWFDLRGLVHVSGLCPTGALFPSRIENIRVGAKGRQIHVLHATSFEDDDRVRVGTYRLNYADGQTAELPIIYGEDTRNWWTVNGESKDTPNASVVWTGHTPQATDGGKTVRLWKRTYVNPRPDVEIISLDFVSAMAFPAPFVLAITVE